MTHYCVFDTAIGPCGVAWSERGLRRLQLPESDRGATERRLSKGAARATGAAPAAIDQLIADIQDYTTGRSVDFAAVAVDLTNVEPFEAKVYAAARAVAWGQTVSYGELARRIDSPAAARAVGRALAAQPGSGRDSVPPRSGQGPSHRRLLGPGRDLHQGAPAGARGRTGRGRDAAVAGIA